MNSSDFASSQQMPPLTEAERRAIIRVAGELIGRAGRTTLVMALRGSRAKRVLQHGAEGAPGYGHFAGMPEADVLARVDALIGEGLLAIEYRDDFPLIAYTRRGLALAMEYAAEEWLEVVRSRVQLVAAGAPLELPFLLSVMPNRNHETVFRVIDRVAREADPGWLPFLKTWSQAETRRARERLGPIIARLEVKS